MWWEHVLEIFLVEGSKHLSSLIWAALGMGANYRPNETQTGLRSCSTCHPTLRTGTKYLPLHLPKCPSRSYIWFEQYPAFSKWKSKGVPKLPLTFILGKNNIFSLLWDTFQHIKVKAPKAPFLFLAWKSSWYFIRMFPHLSGSSTLLLHPLLHDWLHTYY